jgi:hypothetical protein
MKKIIISCLLLGSYCAVNAQTTWAEHAAEVLYTNCTYCHNPNGIAPNSLMTYTDASNYAPLILSYVTNGIMPPWTADSSYQHFSRERILTQQEKDILINWVNDGALEGDNTLAPPPPIYNTNQQLAGVPDLVIEAPNYMSKATPFGDDYVCFVIPSGLVQNKKVRAIEVIPGNLTTLHHCLVYTDPTHANSTDTTGSDCGGPVAGDLMMGYTPGATPTIFPESNDFSAGMIIEAGADIILAMHYPEGSYGTYDQTKVNFYFYDDNVPQFRQIFAAPIIQDWSFTIPANQIDTVTNVFSNITTDFTLLSVFPHMHLIGNHIESYATTPTNDTIPFIRIPHWDFDWQDFYWFEYPKKIVTGSEIHGIGIYDNTTNNPHNPNNPPIDISAGLNTTDEMFLIYFHFMAYQQGDENINVDSLVSIYLSNTESELLNSEVKVYPNPIQESTLIQFNLNNSAYTSVYIYDMQGRIVNKLWQGLLNSGEQSIKWNGKNEFGSHVNAGIYFYSILIDGKHFSGKIVVE